VGKLLYLHTHHDEQAEANRYGQLLIDLFDEQERLDATANIDYLDYAIKEQQLERLVERSRSQTFFLLLAILGCLLAVGVVLAIRRTLRVSRQLNARIVAQNLHLQKALNALEQSQAEKRRMMHDAAHDLPNPTPDTRRAATYT